MIIVDSSGESVADAAVSARVSTLNYGDVNFAIVVAGFQCSRLISGSGVAVSKGQFSPRSTYPRFQACGAPPTVARRERDQIGK